MKREANGSAKRASVRCAIYTRKSTEEGLEQEFNSLDAQRESGEAYIKSQASEGWVCLPDRYDDGGFTGGNMDRPAVKRLMADIEAGKVDCVVVYKVDRLSRSLLDFARMMETFDRYKVSFVSVTQQFNTASSMGRLVLNVLLSFAQFEREIISERTRDKIAATRRKGKWSGGHPILGYDVIHERGGPRLVVNQDEAVQVRQVFELYLKHEALMPVVRELSQRGRASKRWSTKDGKQRGGRPFDKGSLFALLTNVIYAGKIRYRDEIHQGEHEPIVDAVLFNRVQQVLKRNGRGGGRDVRNKHGALLKGLVVCKHCQCGMAHTYSTKKGGTVRYRYYQCTRAAKNGWERCPHASLPAAQVEQAVIEQVRAIIQDPSLIEPTLEAARQEVSKTIRDLTGEKAALERGLKQHHRDVRVVAADGSETGIARLADLHERIRTADQRLGEITAQFAELERGMVTREEVASALAAFEPLWDVLSPREQAQVIARLVERVEFDAENQSLSIGFRPAGIRDLPAAGQARLQEEAA